MQQPYTPQEILLIANRNVIVHDFVSRWKTGQLTWEQALTGIVIVLHQDNEFLKQNLVNKVENQSPSLVIISSIDS